MARMLETTDEKPMRRLGDVMRPSREPNPDERQIVDDVHRLAIEFASLPPERRSAFLAAVREVTTGYERFQAVGFTAPTDRAFQPLMAMLDALIASDGRTIQTSGGTFERDDLIAASASISPTRVLLPAAIDHGTAIYPTESDRGPKILPFRVVRAEETKPKPSRWGADE